MNVLNFGSCNIDYVYLLDHIVNSGETESAEILSVFSGGKGLNQSIAAARAGISICHAGCIGEDGAFLAQLLEDNGVDISHLKQVDGKNGHAMIQVSKAGENAICIYPGSNAKVSPEDIDHVLSHFSQGDLLLLQNEISNVPYLIDRASQKGMRIVLNPSPMNETIAQLDLNQLSYLILNEIEATQITGCADPLTALAYFRSNYPHLAVILTLGKDGSIYQDSQIQLHQPSFEVAAIDTTAAGDTFTGYFVAGLIKGDSIRATLETASRASAIAVSRNGAAPSIPTLAEVTEALTFLKPREANPTRKASKQQLQQYIDDHLASITLKSLGDSLGYSTVYTGVFVKQLTGMNYTAYLRQRRLYTAAERLRNTTMSVGEIIASVGYKNESCFRKHFVEKYGKTPLEYRRSSVEKP